ncbi:hypothetical protein CEQ90_20445 [Lewinellaceae bacterium SD302]|nr:hypothetical protein CEQ90_20445 [Lewinellaceae bacterium SD302]
MLNRLTIKLDFLISVSIFIILLLPFILTAQSFESKFLGNDFSLYKGSLFTIDTTKEKIYNSTLYGYFDYAKEKYNRNILYKESEYSSETVIDSLIGRVFKVSYIVGEDYEPYKMKSYSNEPIFILKEIGTEDIIYYRYIADSDYKFPFLVANIEVPTDYYCNEIDEINDDFTGEIKFSSPLFSGGDRNPAVIMKIKEGGKINYYLSLSTKGATVNVGEQGAVILFEDKTKLNFPAAKISVDADSDGYIYSAFISLDKSSLNKLSGIGIDKFRLYIYDRDLEKIESEKFLNYVQCVKKK